MRAKRILVWFRQDLRLNDNEALYYAYERAEEVVPVYVFDERVFGGKTSFGFPKTDQTRIRFILESVADLRRSLRNRGINLIIRVGKPEEIIRDLARQVQCSWVYCNMERMPEEVAVQEALERNLWGIGREIHFFRGKMLFYTQDLPFPVSHTPDIFTTFRKEVEKIVPIRDPLPLPGRFKPWTMTIEAGELPNTGVFELNTTPDSRTAFPFRGGETAALERLKNYFWDKKLVSTYKETRNELIGADYSTKFSPWLAQGCLSPKYIYAELKDYEAENGANEDTYWLYFELLWRDFFRLTAKKHRHLIFQSGGLADKQNPLLTNNWTLFEAWKEGKTGIPFIDANMRELKLTGYMSNRGRQNVASFLVHDLNVNWQLGAEYFESKLIDYDVCSNYGNWNYVAGVGNDPRENRYFNILTQAKRYDPNGDYVRLWLPELAKIPANKIHQPELLTEQEQQEYSVILGKDYALPLINSAKWA